MKEDREFKASLSYASSRQAWATRNPVFKKVKQINPECSKSKESGWRFFLRRGGKRKHPKNSTPFSVPTSLVLSPTLWGSGQPRRSPIMSGGLSCRVSYHWGRLFLSAAPYPTKKKILPMCSCFFVSESGPSLPCLRSSSKLGSAFC